MISKKINIKINFHIFILILSVLIVFTKHLYSNVNLDEYYKDLLLGIILSIIFLFDYKINYSQRIKKINHFMAEYSYSIYAFHMPIIFFIFSINYFEISLLQAYFVVFITVLILSRILFNFGENKRHIIKKYLEVLMVQI